jgi:hypothetical protein
VVGIFAKLGLVPVVIIFLIESGLIELGIGGGAVDGVVETAMPERRFPGFHGRMLRTMIRLAQCTERSQLVGQFATLAGRSQRPFRRIMIRGEFVVVSTMPH